MNRSSISILSLAALLGLSLSARAEDAPAPTRAEVKAETKAAVKAGTVKEGEPGSFGSVPKTDKTKTKTRAQVKAEAKAAAKAGEIHSGQ